MQSNKVDVLVEITNLKLAYRDKDKALTVEYLDLKHQSALAWL